MVDAVDSKSTLGNKVLVRVRPSAILTEQLARAIRFFYFATHWISAKYWCIDVKATQIAQKGYSMSIILHETHFTAFLNLGLSDDEYAFYDALADNKSARDVLGDDQLRVIARQLTDSIRNNTTIDWTLKESVKAKLRVLVKRILRKYGYPPDLQEKATQTVLEQAELLADQWMIEIK